MNTNKKAPKLRFKGFTDDWEQRKLGECMNSFAYGLNAAAKDYDGMHKYIRITDIDDETHNFIQSNLTSPDIDFNMDVSDYKLNVGDIVFARTGASVGKTYLYNPNDGDLYYAGFLIRGKVKEDCDAGFIYQNTLTKEYDSFIRITSQRSGQPGVNSKEYATFRLNIPCKDEQKKISKVLNGLDELYTLHQCKLEKLKLTKKALLQKLFPKNGKDIPEIRFKGFIDAWEQCKLGNLGTLKNGMNFSKEAMGKGYPFINLQNIFGSNVIDLTKLEKAEATYSQLKDYNLQKGDVLFVRSSVKLEGVGEAALISEDLKDTTYSGFIIRFRDNYGLDYNFKRFIFTTVLIRNQIMSQATNSANKNISQAVLNNLNLLIPTKDEQSKIGLIFSKLDKCITLHQCKLDRLISIKKALLQQLFV